MLVAALMLFNMYCWYCIGRMIALYKHFKSLLPENFFSDWDKVLDRLKKVYCPDQAEHLRLQCAKFQKKGDEIIARQRYINEHFLKIVMNPRIKIKSL